MKIGACLTWQNHDWDRYEDNDFSRPPDVPDWSVFEENAYLTDLIEPLGFNSVFAVEHHTSPHHMASNNLQLMTWIAARTEELELGTNLLVLPWRHPVRTAEEIAWLDNITRGRTLNIGVGRGSAPREFRALGFDMNESRARFKEGVEIIQAALSQARFDYHGDHYQVTDGGIRPHPYTDGLADRLYAGVSTPESLETAARMGLRQMYVAISSWERVVANMTTFNAIRAECDLPAVRPIVTSFLYCAASEDEVREKALQHIGSYALTSKKHYQHDDVSQFKGVKGYEQYAKTAETAASLSEDTQRAAFTENAIWGTPEQCYEKIRRLAHEVCTDHVVLVVNAGNMSRDEVEGSLRLFFCGSSSCGKAVGPGRPAGNL